MCQEISQNLLYFLYLLHIPYTLLIIKKRSSDMFWLTEKWEFEWFEFAADPLYNLHKGNINVA